MVDKYFKSKNHTRCGYQYKKLLFIISIFSSICLPVVNLGHCPFAPMPSDLVKGLLRHTCAALSRVYLLPPSPMCPPLSPLCSSPLSFPLSLSLSFCLSGFWNPQAFRGRDTHPGHLPAPQTCQTLRPLLLPLRPPFLLPAPASRLTWTNGRQRK